MSVHSIFVDATSLALMRQQRIEHAFASDSHLRAAGFLGIPLDLRVSL
jgi:predicted nucleic acid-binding protein